MSHFKAKMMHQIQFPASVRSFVRPSVRPSVLSSLRWSLTLMHHKTLSNYVRNNNAKESQRLCVERVSFQVF